MNLNPMPMVQLCDKRLKNHDDRPGNVNEEQHSSGEPLSLLVELPLNIVDADRCL